MIIDLICLGSVLLTFGFVAGYCRFRRDYLKGFKAGTEAGIEAGAAAATQRANRAIDEMLDYLNISRLASAQDLEELSR